MQPARQAWRKLINEVRPGVAPPLTPTGAAGMAFFSSRSP